uniref:15-cis-phytoene synthase n=1 Tax=Chromera velia CCMP2878 TaxID=1169474 RepID=A0A0G4HC59_9ALVE
MCEHPVGCGLSLTSIPEDKRPRTTRIRPTSAKEIAEKFQEQFSPVFDFDRLDHPSALAAARWETPPLDFDDHDVEELRASWVPPSPLSALEERGEAVLPGTEGEGVDGSATASSSLRSQNRKKELLVSEEQKKVQLAKAYETCRQLTQIYSKTFYLGTQLMDKETAKAMWAIYVWCRRTDDLVDSPRALITKRTHLYDQMMLWEERLRLIFEEGYAVDDLDLALVDTVKRFPGLQIHPFEEMIQGMLMDLNTFRYQTFEELYVYCYRVAGTVGLKVLPVLGTAGGVSVEEAAGPGVDLGIAFQLTNILRDVGEDADRGRIYLPLDDLKRFGVSEQDIFKKRVTPGYKALVKEYIRKARAYYASAERGVRLLSPKARFPIRASLDSYRRILDKIEQNGYDNLRSRAYATKLEKLSGVPAAWMAAQEPPQLGDRVPRSILSRFSDITAHALPRPPIFSDVPFHMAADNRSFSGAV